MLDCFLSACAALIAFNAIFLIVRGSDGLNSLLWNAPQNSIFTDFFESLRDAARGNPYDYGVIYPPLCYVFLWLLSRIVPGDCLNWPATAQTLGGIVVVYLFFFLTTVAVIWVACHAMRTNSRQTLLFSLMFLLSPGYLFMIGQGNIVILALLSLEVFCFFYNSEDAWKREIALLALAVAANIKFYPAIFGVLLLRDKRIKDAFRCMFYGMALFVFPFFSMGGLEKIPLLFENIGRQSLRVIMSRPNYGYGYMINVTSLIDAFCDYWQTPAYIYLNPFVKVAFVLSIILIFFLAKEQWQRIYALTMFLTTLSDFSGMYNSIYILVPLSVFFMRYKTPTKKNLWYSALFLLIFVSFPYGFVMTSLQGLNKLSVSTLLVVISQAALLFSQAAEVTYAALLRSALDEPAATLALAEGETEVGREVTLTPSRLLEKAADTRKAFCNRLAQTPLGRFCAMVAEGYQRTFPYRSENALLRQKGERRIWLVLTILAGSVYYCFFIRSVIPPQTGWWQYMAWRILEGDLPYRDFYLFLPPYYVLFVTGIYIFFGKNFFLYTLFGFFLTRVASWCILYRILIRKVSPRYAALVVVTGLCVTSSYLMDQTFDYNPVVNLLTLSIALLLMKYYESETRKQRNVYISAIGALSGVLLMTKQTVGLVFPFVCVLFLFLTAYWKSERKTWKELLFYFGCFFAALIPGILYFTVNGLTGDFLRCMTSATNAKTGGDWLGLVFLRNFLSLKELFLICVLCWFEFLMNKISPSRRKKFFILSVIGLTGYVFIGYREGLRFLYLILLEQRVPAIVILSWLATLFIFCAFDYRETVKRNRHSKVAIAFFLLSVVLCVSFIVLVPNRFLNISYYQVIFHSFKQSFLYVMLYMDILIWARSAFQILIRKKREEISYFIPLSIGLGLILIQFFSSVLEELHAYILVAIPIPFILLRKVSSRFWNYWKNAAVVISCVTLCVLCLFQKVMIPYEWHSWRTPMLYDDEENPMSAIPVEGLEGFRIPKSDAETYASMMNLVEKYSDGEDIVYQFPNIPLFNVLAERKTFYAAIPYFDVAPDEIAVENAWELRTYPPKMVIWSNLSEEHWQIHETYFRGGARSGQRQIQLWHDDYVTKFYRRADIFGNNDGGSISFYVRAAFAGGIPEERIAIGLDTNDISQYGTFSEGAFRKYLIMIPEDVTLPAEQQANIELYDARGNLLEQCAGILTREDREYWSLSSEHDILVNPGETYRIHVSFLDVEAPFQVGVTAHGSATAEKYCEYGTEGRKDYNLCIFCE